MQLRSYKSSAFSQKNRKKTGQKDRLRLIVTIVSEGGTIVTINMRNLARVTGVTQAVFGVFSLFAIASCSSGLDEESRFRPQEFITTWRVTERDLSITIPTFPEETYDYTVDWGDGKTDTSQTGDATHEYEKEGEYDVSITGSFPRIYFNDQKGNNKDKIIAIKQWGIISWTSMEGAFSGCRMLAGQATDTPVLSNVKSMSSMFRTAHAFNQDISGWDVSSVENMNSMFRTATSFNQNLGNWDIRSLQTAEDMFFGVELSSENYDGLLLGWSNTAGNEVSFDGGKSTPTAESNRDSLAAKSWNITDSRSAFITTWLVPADDLTVTIPTFPEETYDYTVDWDDGKTDANQTGDVSHTYPSIGTEKEYKISITGIFPSIYFAVVQAPLLDRIIAINQWGSIRWTSMEGAFSGCRNLAGQATDTPDLSNVTNMTSMFNAAYLFNQDIGDWDVSNVTNMNSMFNGGTIPMSFDQDIRDWDVSNVTNMSSMFSNSSSMATPFNQDIGDWDVSNVTEMRSMFAGARSFNQDLSGWNVCEVTSNGATNFAMSATMFESEKQPDFADERNICPDP